MIPFDVLYKHTVIYNKHNKNIMNINANAHSLVNTKITKHQL